MSFRNFLDEIKKGLPARNYILTASDRFLHFEAASVVRELLPSGERDFNFHSFDLLASEPEKISFGKILDVLNTVPFFGGRRYVVIENFQKALKKDLNTLQTYLQNPSESCVLILLYEGSLKKEIKEGMKGLKQIMLDVREGDMTVWIRERAKLKGLNLSEETARYLLAIIGPDLGMLSTELEKLTLLGKSSPEMADIAEMIEGKRTYGAFDLIHAIRSRDVEKTFRIFSILRETEEPYGLLGALNWHYSQMVGGKTAPGEKDFAYKAFQLLFSADTGIKTGGFYPFELLLIKLLRLSAQH